MTCAFDLAHYAELLDAERERRLGQLAEDRIDLG